MPVAAVPCINREQFWQLLEIVASPGCDIDTDTLADALDDIANGSPEERDAGIGVILSEMAKYLPSETAD
jgi:hypothetical protein